MTPVQVNEKLIEKTVFSFLQNKRNKLKPLFEVGHLNRTTDIEKTLSEGDTTNWVYRIHIIVQKTHGIFPIYRVSVLAERWNKNLLRSTELILKENNQVMKKLNFIQ